VNRPALYVVLALTSLSATGCFFQASLGAQRSPDGSWTGSAGMAAGVTFDVTDAVGVGVGGDLAIAGYSNQDGGGYAVPGPVMAEGHVRLLSGVRHALALAGEVGIPHGYVSHTPSRTSEPGQIQNGRALRSFLGLSHRYRTTGKTGAPGELYTAVGLQSFAVYGPGFDDVATFGPSATIGLAASARAVGELLDCLLSVKSHECDP
jgi:hypothetical protein